VVGLSLDRRLAIIACRGTAFMVVALFGGCGCGCGPCGGVVGCVFVENYTVDASIFVSLIFVVKLLRAHGGCLGTRSR
jgi:hypothetical protein